MPRGNPPRSFLTCRRISLPVLLIFGLMIEPGCVYFNTFYNAKKFYRQAEKARQKQEQEAFAQGREELPRLSGQAQQLYEKAAQRASRVLEKYKESELVDDAMFLMGKAFYWQGDHQSAARSFQDLEDNFPDSELYDRAQYWRGLSYEGQLAYDKGRPLYRNLFEAGGEVAARSGFRLGEMAFAEEDYVIAIREYQATLDVFPDTELRAELWLHLGEAAVALEDTVRFDQALDAFSRVIEENPSPEMEYKARLNTGQLLYARQDAEGALRTYKRLLAEGRFRPFEGQTRILIGQYHQDRRMLEEALEEYEQVRDDFPQTPSSAMALYQTGLLYLRDYGEGERANEYLQEVRREKGGSEAAAQAQEMLGFLSKLNQHKDRVHRADSLAALQTSSGPVDSSVAQEEEMSSVLPAMEGVDSLAAAQIPPAQVDSSVAQEEEMSSVVPETEGVDSLAEQIPPAQVDSSIAQEEGMSPVSSVAGAMGDSLVAEEPAEERNGLSAAGKEREPEVLEDLLAIAEFYRDPQRVALPDSAIYYYQEIIRRFPDSEQRPRILYSIAWTYEDMLDDGEAARPYLERLIEEYPASTHANAARRRLELEVQRTAEELAAVEFEQIETVRLQDVAALDTYVPLLDSLSLRFPKTEVGAKAAYLTAYSFENVAGDSLEAEQRYQRVLQDFAGSRYAGLVAARDSARIEGTVLKLVRSLKLVGGTPKPGEQIEVLALEPDSLDSVALARKYYGFGLRAQRREAWKLAREFYELSLEQQQKQPEALYQLGNVLRAEGYAEDALELFQEALAARPGMLEVQYRLLEAHIADSRRDSANHYLSQIVQRDRRNPQVEFLREEYPGLTDQVQPEELDLKTLEELELGPPEEELELSFRNELADLPVVRDVVRPVFPEGVAADSATVIIDLLVDWEGRVEVAEVFAGEEAFRGAALTAARAYRFFPAIGRDGDEKRVWVELVIPFLPLSEPLSSSGEEPDTEDEFSRSASVDTVSAAVEP